MEYTILTSFSKEDLSDQVKLKLKEGWTLQGGISTTSPHSNVFYSQALIK